MDVTLTEILVLLFLICLNGFLSMSEISIVASKKATLSAQAGQGDKRAEAVMELIASPTKFLSTVQVGITFISILTGVVGGATLSKDLEKILPDFGVYTVIISNTIVVVGITYVSLIFGEIIPKRLALLQPELTSKAVSPIMKVLSRGLSPLVALLEWPVEAAFSRVPDRVEASSIEEEVRALLLHGTRLGVFEKDEEKILGKALKFADRSVDSLRTPRNEVVWFDINKPPESYLPMLYESQHSYFVAADGNLDKELGVVSIKNIVRYHQDVLEGKISHYIDQPIRIPGLTTALQALKQFRETHKHFALVVDEFGGMDGVLTVHDLLEAIVGDLSDDIGETPEVFDRGNGVLLCDASIDIDELFNILKIPKMVSEEHRGYHSLGGFVFDKLKKIPSVGDGFEYESFSFVVTDMDKQRIDKVEISRKADPD